MSEKLLLPTKEQHNDFLSDLFNAAYDVHAEAYYFCREHSIVLPSDDIKFGFGWKDGYYLTIRRMFGKPKWYRQYKKFFGHDQDIIRLSMPLVNGEVKSTPRNIEHRARVYLTKEAGGNIFDKPIYEHSVWWRVNKNVLTPFHFRHTDTDKIPQSLGALEKHLTELHDIAFIYHRNSDFEHQPYDDRYQVEPFHIPADYHQAFRFDK